MLTTKILLKRIDDIVERSYLGFMMDIVGYDYLTEQQQRQVEALGLIVGHRPLIELIYLIIRNRPTEGYKKDATLNQLLDQIVNAGILPIINDTQQATLDDAKASMAEAITSAKNDIKKRVKQRVIEANKQFKKAKAVTRLTTIPAEKAKTQNHTNLLLFGLAGVALATHKSFATAFTTELTNFINETVLDNITGETLVSGKPPTEVTVYKVVVDDGSLCKWCKKFYTHKDGSPIVYKLSELQANGSNYGKPKYEWLAVVEATHPRCRCELHYANPQK